MTNANKIISLFFLAVSIVLLALSNSNPNNLLFLFVSNEPVANIARLMLTSGMTLFSFRRVITSKNFRNYVKYTGFGLMIFGFYSMISLGGLMYDYVKLLDVFILAEAGVIFTTIALTTTVELQSTEMKEAAKANKVGVPALQAKRQAV